MPMVSHASNRATVPTTHSSHRFLRARRFDIGKTKTMLLSAEQWRKDLDVEDIVK